MEVTGHVVKVFAEQNVSDKFKKRDLIVQTDEQYPQTLSIQFVQDSCSKLDNLVEGELVKVGINLRGREWTNPQGEVKYFNTIQGWYVEVLEAGETSSNSVDEDYPEDLDANEEDDDLPF